MATIRVEHEVSEAALVAVVEEETDAFRRRLRLRLTGVIRGATPGASPPAGEPTPGASPPERRRPIRSADVASAVLAILAVADRPMAVSELREADDTIRRAHDVTIHSALKALRTEGKIEMVGARATARYQLPSATT